MEDERPLKRPKFSAHEYFDDVSRELQWPDIERIISSGGADDIEPGWISGKVFMTFASKQKSEFQLMSDAKRQLKVSIQCPNYERFKFIIGQTVKISLRNASVVRTKTGTSAIGAMPFCLVLKDGATVKLVAGGKAKQDDEVVDSWQVREAQSTDGDVQKDDDWYISSPVKDTNEDQSSQTREDSELATNSSSYSSPLPETPGRHERGMLHGSYVNISTGNSHENEDPPTLTDELAQDAASLNDKVSMHGKVSERDSVPSDRHKRKKLKKRDTRHETSRDMSGESDQDSIEPNQNRRTKLSRAERKKRKQRLVQPTEQIPPSPPKRNPALDLVAGISSESGAYSPLEALKTNSFAHVIGVVAYNEEPVVTRSGDFKVSVKLIDPSNYQYGRGFLITCFMKPGFEHLLPSSAEGHVLLLRNVRVSEWAKGINGVVYADKLKWIGYDPNTGKVYHPSTVADVSQLPSWRAVDAFYQPAEREVKYMVDLGEWRRAVKEEESQGAIQIADFSHKRLEHRLIGSCDVDTFFNATVEILKIEATDFDQTLLFFTDYTPHPQRSVEGFYGQWGMHASTSRIDPCLLDTMKEGAFWSINNMRLKIGRTGYLEADLYAAKLREICDDDEEVYLPDLLKRKEAYLKENPSENPETSLGDTPESLISDISRTGQYNIVAELIYRTNIRDGVTDLYVCDYTENLLLSTSKPEGLKRKLNGSSITVLQIGAWDGREFIRDMEIGGIYTFTDVRISNHHNGSLKGNLKLADKRITKMNPRKTENSAVLALLKRKAEFSNGSSSTVQLDCRPTRTPIEQSDSFVLSEAIRSRHKDQPKSTIEEIESIEECPNKFRLIARIVDFYPLDICDFTVRMCSKCHRKIPDNRNACLLCEDIMQEHVTWTYQFFFRLEDEEGKTLLVDAHSEAKYFLLGLKPYDLRENRDALWAVKRRLQGCLGNLVEVHEALKRQELVEARYARFFDLAVKSWKTNGKKKYSLTGCEAVEQQKQSKI